MNYLCRLFDLGWLIETGVDSIGSHRVLLVNTANEIRGAFGTRRLGEQLR